MLKLKSILKDSIGHIRKTPVLVILSLEIAVGLLISLFVFYFFWEMSETVLKKEVFLFDSSISLFFYNLRNPILTTVMQFLSAIGMNGILILSSLIFVFFYWKNQKRAAILFTVIIGGGGILNMILKFITARPRPSFEPLAIEHFYSFPSGHSMNSFIFFMTIAYFYYHFTRKKKSSLFVFFIATPVIFGIGISRIYLGVHYPSDVLAGFSAGLLWLIFVLVIDKTIVFFRLFKTLK